MVSKVYKSQLVSMLQKSLVKRGATLLDRQVGSFIGQI